MTTAEAYSNWLANGAVVAGTLGAILASVLIHYEGLVIVSRRLGRANSHSRVKVLYAISSLLLLRVLEIWIFALALWGLLQWAAAGSIGPGVTHLFDYVYFSAVCYTTLGFGDLVPLGPIRFLAAVESLAGLVLIAWSASFTYLEMERFWRKA
jgi:uncharacterized membrane protein YcfT